MWHHRPSPWPSWTGTFRGLSLPTPIGSTAWTSARVALPVVGKKETILNLLVNATIHYHVGDSFEVKDVQGDTMSSMSLMRSTILTNTTRKMTGRIGARLTKQ